MLLKDQALAAYEQAKTQKDKEAKEYNLKIEAEVRKGAIDLCGSEEVIIKGEYAFFPKSGIRLRAYLERMELSSWQVEGRCPRCGKKCWSESAYSLSDIGCMLTSFQAQGWGHACRVEQVSYVVMDAVRAAIREVMGEAGIASREQE